MRTLILLFYQKKYYPKVKNSPAKKNRKKNRNSIRPIPSNSPAPGRSIHALDEIGNIFSASQNSHGCRLATADIAIFPKSRLFELYAKRKIN